MEWIIHIQMNPEKWFIRHRIQLTIKPVSYTHLDVYKRQLLSIDEIGEKIAQSILSYFANESNCELINRLKAAGLQLYRTEEEMCIRDRYMGAL